MTIESPTAPKRLHVGLLPGGLVISGSSPEPDINGVTMGYDIFTGWEDLPAIVGSSNSTSFMDGSDPTYQTFGDRNFTIEGWISAPSEAALRNKFKEINAAVPLTREVAALNPGIPLSVWEDNQCLGHAMITIANPTKFLRKGKATSSGRRCRYSLQYIARKPMKLSGVGDGYTTILSTLESGNGELVYTNEGYGDLPPTLFRITDVESPSVSIPGTNQIMSFPGLTVAYGSWLEIDFNSMSVTLDGVNAFSSLEGNFLRLDKKTYKIALSGGLGEYGELIINSYDSDL